MSARDILCACVTACELSAFGFEDPLLGCLPPQRTRSPAQQMWEGERMTWGGREVPPASYLWAQWNEFWQRSAGSLFGRRRQTPLWNRRFPISSTISSDLMSTTPARRDWCLSPLSLFLARVWSHPYAKRFVAKKKKSCSVLFFASPQHQVQSATRSLAPTSHCLFGGRDFRGSGLSPTDKNTRGWSFKFSLLSGILLNKQTTHCGFLISINRMLSGMMPSLFFQERRLDALLYWFPKTLEDRSLVGVLQGDIFYRFIWVMSISDEIGLLIWLIFCN